MYTLVAYSELQDTGGVLTYVSALPDQHVRVEGDNVVVPSGMAHLLGVYASGVGLTECRIEAPSLRRTLLLDVPEIDRGTVVPSAAFPFFNAFYNPLPLDEFEPIRALVAEDASGNDRAVVLLWLGDGAQSPVSGDIYTVRATSATTLTPFQWTNGALNLVQTLPAGRYQVVGFRAQSNGLVAARLVFVGGTWRPGVIATPAANRRGAEIFRRGNAGVLGEFAHDQPPTVDFLSASSDTSEVVHLDLIKVA